MLTLRPYQEQAANALAMTERGILKAPAGSGKTIIAAAALAQWCRKVRPGKGRRLTFCWVANTTEQVDQAHRAIAQFPEIEISCVYKVQCYASSWTLKPYDLLILDECHHAPAPGFHNRLDDHQGMRWGLSATPDREDDLRGVVLDLIGPIVHTIGRDMLVADSQLAFAKVFFHSPNIRGEHDREVQGLAHPEYFKRKARWPFLFRSATSMREQMNRIVYQLAVEIGIVKNVKRNNKVVDLAQSHANDSTLILVSKIDHGSALAGAIPGALVVHSKMGAKKRRDAIEGFSDGHLRCIIATSLADEGLDVPRAAVLILAAAGRSSAKSEQRTGRVLRQFSDEKGGKKTHGIIHDFTDTNHTFLAAQARRRLATYRTLGYEVIFQQELLS